MYRTCFRLYINMAWAKKLWIQNRNSEKIDFYSLRGNHETVCRRLQCDTAFTFKFNFSSKNRTRSSVHKSTEWFCTNNCLFGKGMLYRYIYLKSMRRSCPWGSCTIGTKSRGSAVTSFQNILRQDHSTTQTNRE